MKEKIIIVGGVAGGATLATRLRRISEDYEILIFEKDEYVAFANCGLPYYVGDVIEEQDKLVVKSAQALSSMYNLDIRNFSEILKIDDQRKKVFVKDHKNNVEYEESYDKLVLSTGAVPVVPPFDGLKLADNVFTLRNIPDANRIKDFLRNNTVKKAVVIGGGFIGVEMVENLSELDIELTLIDSSKHILKTFDEEMAAILELNLKGKGVNILTNKSVEDVRSKEVELADGTIIPTDLTIMAIGVKPFSKLGSDIGLELSNNGAIKVNDKFQTSKDDIYAIGDVIEVNNPILNKKSYIPLAWPANRQARVLGDILAGRDKKYNGTIGASVVKVNDLTAASVGFTEEFLKEYQVDYESIIVTKSSRADYYPGASKMYLKLIYSLKGKILGAQAIGVDGVEKRIDVIATAIKMGADIYDLEDLEICYAPPFNSAKDPVNISGYAASNVLDGSSLVFKYDDVKSVVDDEYSLLIDVRTDEEVKSGMLEGAIHIPLSEIRDREVELLQFKDKKLYVYCQVGARGYMAGRILSSYGFTVYNLSGGYNIYNLYKENIK